MYRKLEQHVTAFRDYVAQESANYAGGPEKLMAKFVGRWRDGTPLIEYNPISQTRPLSQMMIKTTISPTALTPKAWFVTWGTYSAHKPPRLAKVSMADLQRGVGSSDGDCLLEIGCRKAPG